MAHNGFAMPRGTPAEPPRGNVVEGGGWRNVRLAPRELFQVLWFLGEGASINVSIQDKQLESDNMFIKLVFAPSLCDSHPTPETQVHFGVPCKPQQHHHLALVLGRPVHGGVAAVI